VSAAEQPVVHLNPAAGEMMIVHPRTDGDPLRVELVLDAAHHAPPAHVHPRARETFTMVEGQRRVRSGRRRWTMQAGESGPARPR